MSRLARWRGALLSGALVVTAACAGWLGIPDAKTHAFEHKVHADQGVHCLSCHDGVQKAGDEGELHLPTKATCIGCHEEPHDERECGSCHGLAYARGSAVRARAVLRFDHAAHRESTKADCVRCHVDAGSGGALMRPRMAACLTCHAHDAEVAAQSCDGCHHDLRNEGTLPEDHTIHEPDFVNHHASAGASAEGMCASCHTERFCTGCHAGGAMPTTPSRIAMDARGAGLHRAGFLARHADEAESSPGLCTSCHAPESCSSCHEKRALTATVQGARNPHPPGWVGPRGSSNAHGPALWRDPASCESCHGGPGEALCVGCHHVGSGGGNPHLPGTRPRGSLEAPPCVACHGKRR